ncbi:hypothetical protein ABPG75_004812 [Micractinium tetrahymenae]
MPKLTSALRNGFADFLLLKTETVRDKVSGLCSLLGLSDEQVSAKFGGLAFLFSTDAGKLKPRFQLLQQRTGRPASSLVARILVVPALLNYPEETLERNYAAVVDALGSEAAAKLLLSRRPDVLISAADRVARNLQTLQQWGCSPEAAVKMLLGNPRLGGLDLEQPAFKARADYWQAAYSLDTAEAAMLQCYDMLHRSLRTVAPRVAFWRSKRPDQALLCCTTFTPGDAEFCRRQGLALAEFEAFKQAWLAGQGAQICRHERG